MSKRWFIDMDGTLNVFQAVDEIEELYEKGCFLHAVPCLSMIEKAVKLVEMGEDVFILSAVLMDSEYALDEKNLWLDKYLPEIEDSKRIFVPCGVKKWTAVASGEGLSYEDILLDDYSKNLHEWAEAGGRGIKVLNGINGNYGTWKGETMEGGETNGEHFTM